MKCKRRATWTYTVLSENISTVKNIALTCSQSLTEKRNRWDFKTHLQLYCFRQQFKTLSPPPRANCLTVPIHIWYYCFISWSIEAKRKNLIVFAKKFMLIINFLAHLSTKCSVSYCDNLLPVVRQCISACVRKLFHLNDFSSETTH